MSEYEKENRTVYVLEKRECSCTKEDLRECERNHIHHLFEAGVDEKEIGVFTSRDEACKVLDMCENEVSDNGQLWNFVEFIVQEYEIDEDGMWITGSDYYTTNRWKSGFDHWTAEGGDTFCFKRLWYAVQFDSDDGWEIGDYDEAVAMKMVNESGGYYTQIAVIEENVRYGEITDAICIKEIKDIDDDLIRAIAGDDLEF